MGDAIEKFDPKAFRHIDLSQTDLFGGKGNRVQGIDIKTQQGMSANGEVLEGGTFDVAGLRHGCFNQQIAEKKQIDAMLHVIKPGGRLLLAIPPKQLRIASLRLVELLKGGFISVDDWSTYSLSGSSGGEFSDAVFVEFLKEDPMVLPARPPAALPPLWMAYETALLVLSGREEQNRNDGKKM